jgi:hypothetical protein
MPRALVGNFHLGQEKEIRATPNVPPSAPGPSISSRNGRRDVPITITSDSAQRMDGLERQAGGTMLVLIVALIIVVGAFAVRAIDQYVDSLPLAIVLQILLLAATICIFVRSLRHHRRRLPRATTLSPSGTSRSKCQPGTKCNNRGLFSHAFSLFSCLQEGERRVRDDVPCCCNNKPTSVLRPVLSWGSPIPKTGSSWVPRNCGAACT